MDAMTIQRPAAADHHEATVTARLDDGCMIMLRNMPVFALVALSCLVQPEPGDRVAALAAGEVWIVAVLQRDSAEPLRLLTRGDAIIGAPENRLDLNFGRLHVVAATAEMFIDQVLHAGRSITAHVAQLRNFARVIETLAERVHLSARSSHRVIEESDQLKARTIDHSATGSLHLQADSAFITGGTAIRMDAGQIHMG